MKKILSVLLTSVMLLALCPCSFAAEEHHVVFTQVSQLGPGETLQQEVDGAVVGIERVPGASRAGGQTWRVWYEGLNTTVEFYMTVSGNEVTSVFDYSISLFGSSYDDPVLSMTSTYGKLTFTRKAILGITSATCWLKGTVTGVDDQIDVTWQM